MIEIKYESPLSALLGDDSELFLLGITEKSLHFHNPSDSFGTRTYKLVQLLLCLGKPSRELIAAIHNLSVSTLKRRLREEDLDFNTIVESVRKNNALRLIKENYLPIEIAYLLGFKNKSEYYRAFRNWFDKSPNEYKKY